MRIFKIIRNIIVFGAALIIMGHSLTSHNHTPLELLPFSQTKTELPDFLKILFSVNLGEGHLKDFKIEECYIEHKVVAAEIVLEISPSVLLYEMFFTNNLSLFSSTLPFYLRTINSSFPLLRGSPLSV